MVTKKTRWLSAIAAVIMLVSMLAGIVVPVGAETPEGAASDSAILNALQKKYAALDPEHFIVEVDGYSVEETRAKIAKQIEDYNNASANDRPIIEDIAEWIDQDFVAANKGNLKSDLIVRYSLKGYYEEMGYDPDASTYYISDVEDWNAAAAAGSIFNNKTLLVTVDIDFEGQAAEPLTVNEIPFMGVLDGQGHCFKNMVINIGDTTPEKSYKFGGLVAALTGGTIKNLGLDGGELIFNGEDTVTDRNEGVGSFAGYIGKGGLLQNCWSTMTVTNNTKTNSEGETTLDGNKNGVSGLIGWGEGGAIDNCFFAGTVNNEGDKRAATDLVGYNTNAVMVYNSIGAGTLNCDVKRNPAAVCVHYTMYSDIDYFSIFNTYAVGKNAIRHRANYDPYSVKDDDENGNTIYKNYVETPETDITFTKDIVHKFTPEETNAAYMLDSLEEAVWAVNRRFDTTHQSADRDYIISVDDNGKLYMAKKEDVKLHHKVTIEGSASGVYYFKEGAKIHLLKDLNLLVSDSITIDKKEFASALNGYELTVPAGDIVINIVYSEESELAINVTALTKKVLKYENLNFGLFNCAATLEAWVPSAQAELAKTEKDLDMIKTLLEMEKEFGAEMALRPGVYPGVTEYETHLEINTGKEWAIGSVQDWLAMIELSKTKTFEGETFHVLKDIDFGGQRMDPLSFDGAEPEKSPFQGTIDGHGNAFKNIKIVVADSGDATIVSVGANVGMIGTLGEGAVIRNFGVESGTITSETKNMQLGTFGHPQEGANVLFEKVWSGVDISATGTSVEVSGILANPTKSYAVVNGAYFYGTLKGTGNEERTNFAIAGDNIRTNAIYNTIGAPTNPSDVDASMRWTQTDIKGLANNYAVGYNTVYMYDSGKEMPGIDNTDVAAASVVEAAYKINQNSVGLKDAKGESLKPIYFTVKDGKVVFGADDGSDQIRKITFENKGVYISEMYAAAGTTVSLDCKNALTIDSISVGNKSALNKEAGTLALGNEDVTIEVTVDASVALEARIAAVQLLLKKYEVLSPDKFAEGEKITAWVEAAQKAIEENDSDALDELIKQEKVMVKGLVLSEDFWPAFTQYENYKEFNRANNWLIDSKADWDAMNQYALAATTPNEYFKGFTFHLQKDVDFANVEMKPLGPKFGKVFSGTIDGHGYGFSNIKINVPKADVQVNDAGTGYFEGKDMDGSIGLFAYLGNCVIRDFGINNGTVDTGTASGEGSVSTFGSVPENTIETAPTFTRVWSGATLKGVENAHVSALVGFLSAKSSAVKVNGFIFTGMMKKASKHSSEQRNTAYGVLGNSGGASVDMGEFYNIITNPTIDKNSNISKSFIFGFSTEDAFKTAMETNKVKNVYGLGGIEYTYRQGASGANVGETTFGKVDYSLIKKDISMEELAWNANQNSHNPTGKVEDAVYFTLKEGKVAFGKTDGTDQICRVVLKNGKKIVKTIYAKLGSEVDLGTLEAQLYQLPEGVKSELNGTMLKVLDKDVVVNVVACSHEGADYSPVSGTATHIIQCNACGGISIGNCEFGSWTANDDLVIDGDRATGTHSASCTKCGNERKEDCEGTLVLDKNDCTNSYFAFDCCTRENINAGKQHIYKNENWTTQGAPSGKEINQCVNCKVTKEREWGQVSVSAENKVVPGKSVDVTITLPALQSGTIKIAPTSDTTAVSVYSSKYQITKVEDGDLINGTLENGIYTATLLNVQVPEGTTITVTVETDKAEFVEGLLKVEITDAENAEGSISDTDATAIITYDGKKGDADLNEAVNLIDTLAVLQHCVDSKNKVHIANADVYTKDGIPGFINAQDALEIIRIWALTLERKA